MERQTGMVMVRGKFCDFVAVGPKRDRELSGFLNVSNGRPLPAQDTTMQKDDHTHASMPLVGFEPTISVFERSRSIPWTALPLQSPCDVTFFNT